MEDFNFLASLCSWAGWFEPYLVRNLENMFSCEGPISFQLWIYSKTCLKWPLKMKTKICFQDPLSLNAGQKYCRMLQGEHSAKFSTFIKLPLVIKIFVLSIFDWPLKTGFTVQVFQICINFIKCKIFMYTFIIILKFSWTHTSLKASFSLHITFVICRILWKKRINEKIVFVCFTLLVWNNMFHDLFVILPLLNLFLHEYSC